MKIYLFLLQSQIYREEDRQRGRSSVWWFTPQVSCNGRCCANLKPESKQVVGRPRVVVQEWGKHRTKKKIEPLHIMVLYGGLWGERLYNYAVLPPLRFKVMINEHHRRALFSQDAEQAWQVIVWVGLVSSFIFFKIYSFLLQSQIYW